jgi:hypothetical protein
MSSTEPAPRRRVDGPRRELKIAIDHEDLDWARSLIRLHPAGFVRTWPRRWINSVYFDSPELQNYVDNVAGIASRRKVRVRWYGELAGDSRAVLELKIRKNGMGWKVRYDVGTPGGVARASWDDLRSAVAGAVDPPDAFAVEQDDQPVLVNRYVREYFRNAAGDCDLTLDGCYSFYDQRLTTRPNVARAVPTFRGMVIELKFAAGEERNMGRISERFPFRLTKSSKYVLGVQSCMAAA